MKKVFLSHSRADSDLFYMLADVLEEEGVTLFRADTIHAGDEWRAEILAAIRSADIFIAAMDDLNPNVLLELGYALGAGKNVLLLRSAGTKVPFDVAALPVKTIDRFDLTTAGEIAEWVRSVAVRERPTEDFPTPRALFEAILNDPELLDAVPPREFEERMAGLFDELGFDVELLPARNDQGFDIHLFNKHSGLRIVVEVKKHNKNSRVSISDVQRIVGAAVVADVPAAMIVTSGGFTSSAHYFSETSPLPVLLLTLDELLTASMESITNACTGARGPGRI